LASDGRRLKILHLTDHSGVKLLPDVPYGIGGTKSKSKYIIMLPLFPKVPKT